MRPCEALGLARCLLLPGDLVLLWTSLGTETNVFSQLCRFLCLKAHFMLYVESRVGESEIKNGIFLLLSLLIFIFVGYGLESSDYAFIIMH